MRRGKGQGPGRSRTDRRNRKPGDRRIGQKLLRQQPCCPGRIDRGNDWNVFGQQVPRLGGKRQGVLSVDDRLLRL